MVLEKIRARAASDIQHIVLPEGEDIRTIQAAEMCVRDKIARITIIGDEQKIRDAAQSFTFIIYHLSFINFKMLKIRS